MKITSFVFQNNSLIPRKYTCEGADIHPHLAFSDVPPDTKSLVLIMEDLNNPKGILTHWLVWNILPFLTMIEEGKLPESVRQGTNDFGKIGYSGPCPGNGAHRYRFCLYALTDSVSLLTGVKRTNIEKALQGKIITHSSLIGTYVKNP